jgi:hypothetical protein
MLICAHNHGNYADENKDDPQYLEKERKKKGWTFRCEFIIMVLTKFLNFF